MQREATAGPIEPHRVIGHINISVQKNGNPESRLTYEECMARMVRFVNTQVKDVRGEFKDIRIVRLTNLLFGVFFTYTSGESDEDVEKLMMHYHRVIETLFIEHAIEMRWGTGGSVLFPHSLAVVA